MGCCGGGGKLFVFVIELLTGDKITVGSADGLSPNKKARELLEHVYRHLSISSRHSAEREFLGLRYHNPNSEQQSPHHNTARYNNASRIWTANQVDWLYIDPNRPISHYCRGQVPMNQLYIAIRYFVADPTRLLDDNTRTQFYLQLRKDLLDASLTIANQRDSAELSALIAQIEYGDFDKEWRSHTTNPQKTETTIVASSPSTNNTERTSPEYSSYAIGINKQRMKPMTPEFDKMVYRAHKDLIGLTVNEAQMRFLWKCHKLTLYGIRRFPLASDRNLWLGLSPRGLHLFEVHKRPPGKPVPATPTGVTEPPEQLDKMASYPWMSITQIDYCDKLFEFHHTASTQLGSTDTVTLECPSKYTCKVLWRTAVEFHNFYKVQRGHDCMDSRRSSGVFTRHDRLSLHNGDFHGSQNNQSFGLAASRAGSQNAMDQLSRHGSAGGLNKSAMADGGIAPSKFQMARRNFRHPMYPRSTSQGGWHVSGAQTDGEYMKGTQNGNNDQIHRLVDPNNKFASSSNMINGGRSAKPGGRGAITDVDGIQSASGTALVNGQLQADGDRRKQRMKERMNDPRYKDNKTKRQEKINKRIRDELRKHIQHMEQAGNAPSMPQDGEIQYIQIQTAAGQSKNPSQKATSTTEAAGNGNRSRGHFTDVDGPMGRNKKNVMNKELAQYQRHIKDYVQKHKHTLSPEVLEKGNKKNSSSVHLQPANPQQTSSSRNSGKPTKTGSSTAAAVAAGLVGPLPITKQVLSEEEFNQTQKDPNLMVQTRQTTRVPSQLTQAASPKKFNHYQNPQNYHRQVQPGKGPRQSSDNTGKRSGYNSDWDVKYQYHPPPKYNKNRPIGPNGGSQNGIQTDGGQQQNNLNGGQKNISNSQHFNNQSQNLSSHNVNSQNLSSHNLNSQTNGPSPDKMKLTAGYGTQV